MSTEVAPEVRPGPEGADYDLVRCKGCKGEVWLKVPRTTPVGDAFGEAVTLPLPTAAPIAGPSIVVIQTAYYLRPGREVVAAESRWETRVAAVMADQQPYAREITVDETWAPLDLGWLSGGKAGWIDIANDEGRRWERIPTDEERAAVARRVVEVSASPLVDHLPEWEVLPGRSHQGAPVRPLFVRCRPGGGAAKIVVTAFPR